MFEAVSQWLNRPISNEVMLGISASLLVVIFTACAVNDRRERRRKALLPYIPPHKRTACINEWCSGVGPYDNLGSCRECQDEYFPI